MSGISGIVNPKQKIDEKLLKCKNMSDAVASRCRGKTVKTTKYENAVFSAAADFSNPFEKKYGENLYSIVFDGEIYNINEIKDYLSEKMQLSGKETDAELILNLFVASGNSFLKKLNGVFALAIWNNSSKELLLARDRFGIKPLYYSILGGTLYFSSEIKGLLASGDIKPVLKKEGILHLFSIGPALEQGNGILSGIYELLPATTATYNQYGVRAYKYWSLESKRHTDSPEETAEKVSFLVSSAIKRQLKAEQNNFCCFLSGGLDSSIITALAAEESEKPLNTFSVKYTGNDEFFVPNDFQPNSDDYFINLMSEKFSTNHTVVEINQDELFDALGEATTARDHPGMADIDSSLLLFCKRIGKNFENALSGECADEVFGGYPWFYKKDFLEAKTFPWAKNTDIRENITNKKLIEPLDIKNYIDLRYKKSIAETPYFAGDVKEEILHRQMSHLNLNWFMYSLGARSERCGMHSGLNIRMPFCDYKLTEYVWNIPKDIKTFHGREKGILRTAFKSKLPEEIFLRKKSPFPKTHNPVYEKKTRDGLREILNGNTPLKTLIDMDYVLNLLDSQADYAKPWFGQLMALPQLFAYLIQIDFWLKTYKIQIEI